MGYFSLGDFLGGLVGLLDHSGVRQLADSPEAKALAARRLMAQAGHTLPGIIADEIAHGDPGRTAQAVIDDIDGRLWHNARPDITDYYVASLRDDPTYDGPLRDLIRQALVTAAAAAPREDAPSLPTGAMHPDGAVTPLGSVIPESPQGIVPPHEDASGLALPPHVPPPEPAPVSEPAAPQTFAQ